MTTLTTADVILESATTAQAVADENLERRAATGSNAAAAAATPEGSRWAIAAPGVDISGEWSLVVTDEFKKEYDKYLEKLRQPWMVRSVALSIIGMTTEETKQTEDGRSLVVRGKNVRGIWDRTFVASGADVENAEYTPLLVEVLTADSVKVQAESWWENKGTVHVSWLRDIDKYGGGSFESRRYLEEDGTIYVCESTFFPDDKERKAAQITWRFRRQEGSTL